MADRRPLILSANGRLRAMPTGDTLGVAAGGTGATTAAQARTNLGLGSIATQGAGDYLPITGGTVTGASGFNSSLFVRDIVYLGGTPANTGDKLRVTNSGANIALDAVAFDASVFKPMYLRAASFSFGGLGGLATFDGSVRANGLSVFTGTFGVQAGILARGWSNGVTRWLDVMESDASLSLWSYDTGGATATQVVQYRSAVAGGSTRAEFKGQAWAVGMRTHTWSGVATNGVLYFGTGDSYIYKAGGNFTFVNVEGGYTANLASAGTILTSNGDQVINPGTLRIRPVATTGDQLWIRAEGTTGVTIDAVNAANSAYAQLSLRGTVIVAQNTFQAQGSISSNGALASISFMERADFGAKWDWYSTGGVARLWRSAYGDRMSVDYQGNVVITGRMDTFSGVTILAANGSVYVRVPRIFVGGGDPGAASSDGDIWIT